MKKFILCALLTVCLFAVSGCNEASNLTSLEKIPDTYSLEQAREDGCVIHENGDVTQGKDIFEAFFNASISGKKGTVRLVSYYTLDDPSHYDPDYYESIKDDYPKLYIQDLSFDGQAYTLHWYENGEKIIRSYSYLMKYDELEAPQSAAYKSCERYVLTNDDTVTWQDLFRGLLSSRYGDYIDHNVVCADYHYE